MRPALSPRRLDSGAPPLASPTIGPRKRAIVSSEDIWELLDYDHYIFEPDVLWMEPYDTSGGQITRLLRALGKRVLFASHAVDCNREVLQIKLAGVDICTRTDLTYTTAFATGDWLVRHRFRRVYLIGGPALEDALIARAISYDGRGTDDDNCVLALDPFAGLNASVSAEDRAPPLSLLDYSIQAVVVCPERRLNHVKLSKALRLIRERKLPLILPLPVRAPSCAAMLTSQVDHFRHRVDLHGFLPLVDAADPSRIVCTAKPGLALWDSIQADHHLNPLRTLLIGNDLARDIAFGTAAGASTLLIGSSTPMLADRTLPDYTCRSLSTLARLAASLPLLPE